MKKGTIIIDPDAGVWLHEMKTAQALANAGYDVHFIRKSEMDYARSADAYVNNILYEFKAPKSMPLKSFKRKLRDASKQSVHIVFDTVRYHGAPDALVERQLRKDVALVKAIKKLLFINRKREVIEII